MTISNPLFRQFRMQCLVCMKVMPFSNTAMEMGDVTKMTLVAVNEDYVKMVCELAGGKVYEETQPWVSSEYESFKSAMASLNHMSMWTDVEAQEPTYRFVVDVDNGALDMRLIPWVSVNYTRH